MCAVGSRYLTTKKAQGKLEIETPNGGFSGVKSEKLSPLSSEWGARSQPEALGPGARPPVFIRVTYHMAQINPQNHWRQHGPRSGPAFETGVYLVAA